MGNNVNLYADPDGYVWGEDVVREFYENRLDKDEDLTFEEYLDKYFLKV